MMASFKPKSVVFDYFEMPDDTSGKYRAKCKQCTATYDNVYSMIGLMFLIL